MKDCDASRIDSLTSLERWYQTPLGLGVASAESRCLEDFLEESFGYFLLQIGASEPFAAARNASRIRHHFVLDGVAETQGSEPDRRSSHVCGELFRLPFASDSLDAVVLPHTLDFSPEPHRVLREVERVLVAEGRIILFGFNPLSSWGLRRIWPRRRSPVPWCGSHLTCFRVCDWLKLVGLHLEARQLLVFRPPVRRAFSPKLDWVDSLGARYWPLLGGVYAIRAVKRLSALTPLRSPRKLRPALLPGRAVKPTARESSYDKTC